MKEPEIKLFGRKIVLVGGSTAEFSEEGSYGFSNVSREAAAAEDGDDQVKQVITQEEKAADESQNTEAISELENNPNTPSIEEADTMCENHPNEQTETTNPKQKALKKPDKILPCPRCASMDTKFCYYNNYNVNQPRHFCKNCQRYWTAGGSIRNVPVGAGRRKNKNSLSNCRQITISEALNESNGTVLSFGPDSCNQDPAPKNWDDSSLRSCNSTEDGVKKRNVQGPTMQYVNGYFPWNSAVPVPVQVPFPAIYPVPVYPTPYAWNVQYLPTTTPNSPLGKHTRNGELIKPILIPKTLRIDDPEEAARSSIWSTLGIKNESVNREALFKALQSKSDVINTTASSEMPVNHAAMSRSIRFQERV